MAYYTQSELNQLGFRYLGIDVLISKDAKIYNPNEISIDDHSRIDDFCILSGKISIGKYVHITPMCLIAGGIPGITLEDYCTLAYGVKIFSQSDDYSGETMTNSLIPKKFKNEYLAPIILEKHVIIGTNSTIMPGVIVKEGCAIGAMTLVNKSTEPWGIYTGSPARKLKPRSKALLKLEHVFYSENSHDPF